MKTYQAVVIGMVLTWLVTAIWSDNVRSRENARWMMRLQDERNATATWRERSNEYQRQMVELRKDSVRLHQSWRAAAGSVDSVLITIEDTVTRRRAREAMEAERQACSLVVLNCEARARAAEVAQADAAHRVDSLAAALDTTGTKWQAAERRAEKRLSFGVGAGYGAVLSGGRTYTGPSVHVGVQYRFSLRDLFGFF